MSKVEMVRERLIMRIILLILLLASCSQFKTTEVVEPMKAPEGSLKVAVVNYEITGNKSVDRVVRKIESFMIQAKNAGAKILLVPELVTLDLFPTNPPDNQVQSLIESVAGEHSTYETRLSAYAKKHDIMLVGASSFVKKGKKFVNRAYIIYPDGKLKYQDKNYPTPWEVEHNVKKTSQLTKFEFENFKFVVLICHDAEFPKLSHKLSRIRPEVIFVPSQTDDDYGLERVKRTSQARAVEHMAYVVMTGTSSVAGAPWHTYQGQNFLMTPQNKYFTEPKNSGKKEVVSIFALDLEALKKARADKKQIYPARDEK